MAQYVNPDNSAFDSAYKDKGGLIDFTNNILSSPDAFIYNSRPRHFGKSMAANGLVAYCSKGTDSKELFSSLKIDSSPDFGKHLNKYA